MALDNDTIVTITYSDRSVELRTVKRLKLLFMHERPDFQLAFFKELEEKGRVDIQTAVYELKGRPVYTFAEKLGLKKL